METLELIDRIEATEDSGGIVKSFGTVLKNNPAVLRDSLQYKVVVPDDQIQVPKTFDGRVTWKKYLRFPVKNQGKCGNCWAQAVCGMLEDKFLIQTRGKIKMDSPLSTIHLTICEYQRDLDYVSMRESMDDQEKKAQQGHSTSACNGNSLYNAVDFLYRYGVPTSKCIDPNLYTSWCQGLKHGHSCQSLDNYRNDDDLPSCEDLLGVDYDTCLDGKTAARRYRAISIYNVQDDEYSIMHEIYKWGPVATGFQVFPDFMRYDGKSIYTHPNKDETPIGGHAVCIYGWGEEMQEGKLVKYWLIRNSWGPKWGDNGFCRIQRNIPEIQLEKNIVCAIPSIPYITLNCIESQTKMLQEAIDDDKRRAFGVDDLTGYRKLTIQKIQQGKLIGDLTPLIKFDEVPQFCKYIAAEMDDPGKANVAGGGVGGDSKMKILIPIGILLIIGYIIYRRRKNRRY